jgi:hypothetical protein
MWRLAFWWLFSRWLLAKTLAIVLVLAVPALANCPDLAVGVNATTLSWETDQQWRQAVDEMAANGVRYLRIGFHPPLARLGRIIKYANENNIKVLISAPLGLPRYYPNNVKARPRNAIFRAVSGLSNIDIDRFAAVWRDHRQQLRGVGARVFAYEIGNEINNPDFNGDFPLEAHGRVMPLAACDLGRGCDSIDEGFRKYVELLRFVRQDGDLDGELVIGSGLSNPQPSYPSVARWLTRSGGVFAPARDVIEALQRLGAGTQVDGYAIHLYPPSDLQAFNGFVANAMADCRLSGHTGKSCWITEWGFRSTISGCNTDPERTRKLIDFVHALRQWSERGLAGAFYYDWEKHPRLSIFRCGHWVADPAAVTTAFCER